MERKKIKTVVAILARMGSKRLPNKLILPLEGKRVIDRLIEHTKQSQLADEIVMATTTKAKDDVLEQIAREHKINCFRGEERDTLSRLYGAAIATHADALLRITGDNVIADPMLIDDLISEFKKRNTEVSFVSTCLPPTFPEGFSMEIVSTETLGKMNDMLTDPDERAAFMVYLASHPEDFPRHTIKYKKDASHIRLTLDYPDDFKLLEKVFKHFVSKGKEILTVDEVVDFFDKNSELVKINQHHMDRTKYPYDFGKEAIKKAI